MATTTARNKQQVDEMSKADRLWDSLNYSYGKQRDNSDEQFRKAYSQADRQMLSRGMQRSSYGAQTLADIDKQRVKAQNDIYDAQIADYENRLQQAEQQDLENERWERQFAAGREDAEWNRNFQQERANAQDTQFQLNFDEGQRQFNENMGYQRERAGAQDAQWQQQFDANRSDTAWNQAFQQRQYEANRDDTAWNRAFQERQYADTRSDTAWNQAFQREQADTQNNQWQTNFNFQQRQADLAQSNADRAFNYQQSRDAVTDTQWQKAFDQSNTDTDRKLASSYVSAIIANGGDPTDELLARAGLSRADANAMKAQVAAGGGGGGGGGYSYSGGGSHNNTTNKPLSDSDVDNDLNSGRSKQDKTDIVTPLVNAYRTAQTVFNKAITSGNLIPKPNASTTAKANTTTSKTSNTITAKGPMRSASEIEKAFAASQKKKK